MTTTTRGPVPGSNGMPSNPGLSGEAASATPSPVDVAAGAKDAADELDQQRREQDIANQMICDGNTAASDVAFRINELCSIYPITPSSPMAEMADEWAARDRENIWGQVPHVMEMQSEAGAAGAMHGSLQGGALATTFTASQGLLLMIPNMYKIAGELTSTVMHVAARSLATQGLSIFGDHQDVMACRQTGWAMLCSSGVQQCHDNALIAQVATLRTRVPFIHFFDGFRTSHELNTCIQLTDDQLRSMVPDDLVREHRDRALSPENPFIRGTAQNADVYFQGREAGNKYYDSVPGAVQDAMDEFARMTGRQYHLADYYGAPDAERVIVIMGSGAETVQQTVTKLNEQGEKVGMLVIRLYRPFPTQMILDALPETVKKIAVMDRTKEPGSNGEPLYLDIMSAVSEAYTHGERANLPTIIGGRYGLSSKEFTPGMCSGVFDELAKDKPKRRFTIGITDDVTHLSIGYDASIDLEDPETSRAVFYGIGADGTVGANKNTIKILGHEPGMYAQGYFVYDSKKSGGRTTSHLRFGPDPIKAPYLVTQAGFIGVHHWADLERIDVLAFARKGTVVLINSPYDTSRVWDELPKPMQKKIIDLDLQVYAIDAGEVARSVGLGNRTNTVLQTCYFKISGVLPADHAIEAIKDSITKTYAKKSMEIVEKNHAAVDASLEHLHKIEVPASATSNADYLPPVPQFAPDFVKDVTAAMMTEQGESLPVSKLPADGSFPSGTTQYEKRNVSEIIAVWDKDNCIQCGNCAFVCPHAVIRAKYYKPETLGDAPDSFESVPLNSAGLPNEMYTLQVYAEDCTGCGICVEACPVHPNAADPSVKAINLDSVLDRTKQRANVEFFEKIPEPPRTRVNYGAVRGAQFLQPLFEFSGACPGCGETPYLKLLTQLFGDRATVANATGCSSIYGGNLPTTPWAKNKDGRGPAWSNSLFEDNAEFGLGMRLAADLHAELARQRVTELADVINDPELVDALLNAPQAYETDLHEQADRVETLKAKLAELSASASTDAQTKAKIEDLRSVADNLLRRSVWIVGGDGWAYDIGSGGVDHALSTGRNINILVLDTEVYSNTGGQASKSSPMGVIAKFATAGKRTNKKDIAMQAVSYGDVYVARVAFGADPEQTLKAFREAEAYPGPSLIIAYSHCISHGYNLRKGLDQQYKAVASGHWPLIRYNPELRDAGANPFLLDSARPRIPLADYRKTELRYKMLMVKNPEEAKRLNDLSQEQVRRRFADYEEMAARPAEMFATDAQREG